MHVGMPSQESWEDGRNAVRQLIHQGFDASAIVCVNDMTALSVLRALRDRDISCPGHVSVTGFDNIPIAHLACPSLTTAHVPRDQIAEMLFKSLTAKPGTPATDNSVDPEVIVRESTGPFRGYGLISAQRDTPRTIN